jgi:hypothetical protein
VRTIAGALRGHERGRRRGDESEEGVACEHCEEYRGEGGLEKVKGGKRRM